MCEDILKPIANADIPKLRDIYKKELPRASYIYNYLTTVIRWKSHPDNSNYITIMAPHGNWKDGTFISIHEYSCYELFMFTLEKDCRALCEALITTKKINWNRGMVMYAIYSEHYPFVRKALEKTTYRFYSSSITDILWISKEKAVNFEINCPSEVYIAKLEPSHASIINSQWPPRYEGSDKYIATIIEMNGGYGVFLKSNGTLVAWVLRNLLGLGALQTANDYKRKGYASLVTKVLSKEFAESGGDPLGTVHQNNITSQSMFKKLGFEILGSVVYAENQEIRTDLQNEHS